MSIVVNKRQFLSGDDAAFHSVGKEICRLAWHKHSNHLATIKGKGLDYLWLANNQLTDIDDLLPTAKSFTIPDNNDSNRAAKRKTLVAKYGLPKRNDEIRVIKSFAETQKKRTFFDVINLDTCNHLDTNTLNSIEQLVEWQIEEKAYLFATFSTVSMRSVVGVQFPEYRRLSGTKEGIQDILEDVFNKYNYKHRTLAGFPLTYESGLKKTTYMHSFGWELNKI